jgi:sulfate adenylyltransferase subunit 2
MLYSIGKDSSVMLHLAMKAFFPAKPPFPLLHVDTTWKFREMIAFRDETAARLGLDLLIHVNEEGVERGVNAVRLRLELRAYAGDEDRRPAQALDKWGFDAAFGGARRDEEKSRAKERIFSHRTPSMAGTRARTSGPNCGGSSTPASSPANRCASFRCRTGPNSTSGTTSLQENIPVVPLYFAKERPVVERDGSLIMVDDDRMPLLPGETPRMEQVRFRTLGCYPLTGRHRFRRRLARGIIAEMRASRRRSVRAA